MKRFFLLALTCFLLSHANASEDTLSFDGFGSVTVYNESLRPANVVLFVSGDGGWNLGVVDMARSLATLDALVVGIDITRYLHELERSTQPCSYPAGDFELLSKYVQKKYGYEDYVSPILVGYSSGATLIYASLVQAPPVAFRGGISLGFCPDLPLSKPLCRGNGLDWTSGPKGIGYSFLPATTLEVPWVVLQGDIDQVCMPNETQKFVNQVKNGRSISLPKVGHGFSVIKNWMPQLKEAFASVVKSGLDKSPDPTKIGIGDLPLVEVPSDSGDILAVHLTGDGGWGITDKGLSRSLADSGIAVVALNSLHYFWRGRDPDGAAKDLERILRHYLGAWKKSRIILIGYSLGADILPFMTSRLPAELLSKVKLVVLIGPSEAVDFKFHLTDWLGRGPGPNAYLVAPEIDKLSALRVICFYGERDKDVICSQLQGSNIRPVVLEGGHLVRGRFDPIVEQILRELRGLN